MTEEKKSIIKCDLVSLAGFAAVCAAALWKLIAAAVLGEAVSFITAAAVSLLVALLGLVAWRGRVPALWAAVCAGSIVLASCVNYGGWGEEFSCIVWAAVSGVCAVAGTALQIFERAKPRRGFLVPLVAFALAAVFCLGSWAGHASAARGREGAAGHELWQVPARYDTQACPQPGRVEELAYETRAYAADGHAVTKRAYVYLPYGYTEEERYDILYLLHGTGDDEAYWLVEYGYNKTMLDNLIYHGDIRPVIVVTPTWYVEGVCEDDPDALTYSFKDELKNDLIPAVEGAYSTYAQSCSREDLIASRGRRAFAGLSRGAATTWHSAYCGALEYFSMFGAFSGMLTPQEEFAPTQAGELAEYEIQYLYNTSGAFDFLLSEHWRGFGQLLASEPRLLWGKNCSFDVFPMVYHHMESWHLALYNALQLFFPAA